MNSAARNLHALLQVFSLWIVLGIYSGGVLAQSPEQKEPQKVLLDGKHAGYPGREAGGQCFSVLARGYMPRASGDLAETRSSLDGNKPLTPQVSSQPGIDYEAEKAKAEAEKAKAEAEKAKAEAEKAKAEAEKAKAEAEKAKAEAEKAKAEAEKVNVEAEKEKAEAEKVRAEAAQAFGEDLESNEEVIPEGFQVHDGFFLRLTGGLGLESFSATGDGLNQFEPVGSRNGLVSLGLAISISVGGRIWDNLILHGDFWGSILPSRGAGEYKVYSSGCVGGGLTYYFMPLNLYVAGSLGMGDNSFVSNKKEATGQLGVGAYIMVGKEFWISPNWGLGLALRGELFRVEGEKFGSTFGGGLLLFSATYN